MASQPHSFFDFVAVSLVLPDQQIGDPARIVEIASHKPCGDDGHVFAVESRPKAKEMTMRSAPLFSLLHPSNPRDYFSQW